MSKIRYATVQFYSFLNILKWRTTNGITERNYNLSSGYIQLVRDRRASIPSCIVQVYSCNAGSNFPRFTRAAAFCPLLYSSSATHRSLLDFLYALHMSISHRIAPCASAGILSFYTRHQIQWYNVPPCFTAHVSVRSGSSQQYEAIVGSNVHGFSQMET